MKNLINITTKEGKQLVDARELHEFLENKRQFADWIKQRIEQYGFSENEDFTVHKFVNGKAIQKDYVITIEMAKELSMVENNEKGKQARRYFIECEKALKNPFSHLSREVQAIFVLDKKQQEIERKVINIANDFEEFKNETPLFNIECDELLKSLKKKGVEILGGYKSPAYNNRSLRGKVYSDIQGEIKRNFGLRSYKAIKRSQIDVAHRIIKEYKAPICLVEEIDTINNQIALDEIASTRN